MFFFLIAGVRDAVRRAASGAVLEQFCPRCRQTRLFLPAASRKQVTLFFLPLFSLGRERAGLVCEGCGLWVPRR
jgi:hypothetical protein